MGTETNKSERDMSENGASINTIPPAVLIDDVFDHIISNPGVIFKIQQINDPELSAGEKDRILREVLNKSHCTFLSRFGPFMKDEHLRYFEQDEQTIAYSPDERYEIDHRLECIRNRRNGEGARMMVKNRRYVALKKMCNEGTYFSEQEMMQRAPMLYEHFVGQYMTEREKQERDASVPMTLSVVNIVLNKIDKDEAKEKLKKLETEEYKEEQCTEDLEETIPRAQWGNFDDEEENRLEARRHEQQQKAPVNLVNAWERNELRNEFIDMMHARFLNGGDEEFDYSQVDNCSEYDDLDAIERDKQEKYFDNDDETDTETETVPGASKQRDGEESEDELDVYMRHLNYHLQQQERVSMDSNAQVSEYDSDE